MFARGIFEFSVLGITIALLFCVHPVGGFINKIKVPSRLINTRSTSTNKIFAKKKDAVDPSEYWQGDWVSFPFMI